jgi:tagaturonate reductase
LDVKIVSDMQPYRTRKVRILNGAHTAMVPVSMLYGHETVQETVEDRFTGPFVRSLIFDEINPTLPMDAAELQQFADEVLDRFRNPFIRHLLADISLNSVSKFKVRVLPSLLEYIEKFHKIPVGLTFSFACLLRFYKGEWNGSTVKLNDSKEVIEAFEAIWKHETLESCIVSGLSNTSFWEDDLTKVKGLQAALLSAMNAIEEHGIEHGFVHFKSTQNL